MSRRCCLKSSRGSGSISRSTVGPKLCAEFTDTVAFGSVVARLHKGSQFAMQQVLVNGEVWLPQHAEIKLDARIALLKEVNESIHLTYNDYRKFRTDTKISIAGSAPTQ